MARRMPNLNQLRAFEAAARHGSFKDAADELHVTHAAVSHQIKALEEYLGTQLFRRQTRSIQILPEAAQLADRLMRAFDTIADATAEFSLDRAAGTLRLSCVPAFGYRFLLPRMPDFHKAHPEITVDLTFAATMTDLAAQELDGALRYGLGHWPGHSAVVMQADRATPMCTPEMAADRTLPMDGAAICKLPFAISPGAAEDWDSWLTATNTKAPNRPQPLALENRAVLLDFLLQGQTVALMDVRFAATEMASGKLIRMHDTVVDGVNGIYLVWPETPFPDPKLKIFGDWLIDQVAQIDTDLGMPWRGD